MVLDSNNSYPLADIMTVIQAVILFIGLGLTCITIYFQKVQAKRLATLELIIHQRSNLKFNESFDILTNLINNEDPFCDLSRYLKDRASKESQAILEVLNFREFVAVGINSGIIDESTYKNAYCSTFVRDWEYLEHTVKALRKSTGKQTFFQDFEILAKKWKNTPLKCRNIKI